MTKQSKSLVLSCTIPTKLSNQLNLLAQVEERSKSYYVKKALQEFFKDKFEKIVIEEIGEEKYKQYLELEEKGIPYEEILKELELGDNY
ncbi:MAG: putative DNA-binding protein [Lentimonas sp.]|jgi:predicted DNA-binding protein